MGPLQRVAQRRVGGLHLLEPPNAVVDQRVWIPGDRLRIARAFLQPPPVVRAGGPKSVAEEDALVVDLTQPLEDHHPAHVREAEGLFSPAHPPTRPAAAPSASHPIMRLLPIGSEKSPPSSRLSPPPSRGRTGQQTGGRG